MGNSWWRSANYKTFFLEEYSSSTILFISMITAVIIEMRMLWLVDDCINLAIITSRSVTAGRTRAKSNICQFFREPKIGKSFPISNFLRLSHQTSILWQNFIDWYIRQSQTYLPLLKDEENFPARITGQEGIVSNDYFKNFPVFVEVCLSFSTK